MCSHQEKPALRLGRTRLFYNNGPSWAAAIAFYSLLSLFPLLLAAGSVASYFIDPHWAVLKVTALLGDFLPRGRVAIEAIIEEALEGGGLGMLFFVPMVWTGTLVFGTLTKALNVAFEGASHGGYLRQVQVLARYNFVYGSLAGIIAAVMWAWVVSMIGIFGGQMASIWQAVMVEGDSLDTVKRRHLPDLE